MSHMRDLTPKRCAMVLSLAIVSACGPKPHDLDDVDALGEHPPAPFAAKLVQNTDHSAIAVVAHPDDDLLFMSQFLTHAVSCGLPLRVIYLTAGDAGRPSSYWKKREEGIRAAYSTLMGAPPQWVQTPLMTPLDKLCAWSPAEATTALSLVFVRLPDGNNRGQGYKKNHHQSLAHLWREQKATITALDDHRSYSKESLIALLQQLYDDWQNITQKPPVYSTLNCCHLLGEGKDHSDHRFASLFAVSSRSRMLASSPLFLHWGYDITHHPENLNVGRQQRKWAAFLAYAPFDPAVWAVKRKAEPLSLYVQASGREYAWHVEHENIELGQDFCQISNTTMVY